MLGGSFWIAFLRNAISVVLMLSFFLMLDRPRFSMKKTVCCYAIFGVSLIAGYSCWYLFGTVSFVKYAALSVLPVIGIFCSLMSSEVLYAHSVAWMWRAGGAAEIFGLIFLRALSEW